MLLRRSFDDPQLNLALELFVQMLRNCLGEQLISVVIHGSIVFDDLALGYGDLDFLAVVRSDLSEATRERLRELRRPLRSGEHGVFAAMIEGAFLPRAMLDPAVLGKAFWWGTSGERPWERNQLGWLVLEMIRERGLVIWGEDVRRQIPAASPKDLLEDVRSVCKDIRKQGRGGGLHSVDWLLTAARLLLWLREGRFSSKSEAADWGYSHARGMWREFLPRAKEIRLNPKMAQSPEVQRWLGRLTRPIQEACNELEAELMECARHKAREAEFGHPT